MPKISKKLQGHLDEIERMAWMNVSSKTSDSDFIATIQAINQYCLIADSLDIDREDLRKHMNALYAEFSHRVYAKRDIQDAYALICCLREFIFGRGIEQADCGPKVWQMAFVEMSLKAITAYRKNPTLHPYQYVTLLRWYAVQSRDKNIEANAKLEVEKIVYQQFVALKGANSNSDEALMNGILLRSAAIGFAAPNKDNDFGWTDLLQSLIAMVDVKTLTDEQLLLWLRTASLINDWPYDFTISVDAVLPNAYKELLRRKSLSGSIDALGYQALTELQHTKEAETKRETAKEDRAFIDDFLVDVLPIKIDEGLSTEALLALYNIYLSRYMSIACLIGGDTRCVKNFCKRRHAEIFSILSRRLSATADIYLKVKILDAMIASETEFCQPSTTRDAKSLVGRTINALLENDSTLPKLAELQLLAMKYGNYDYDDMATVGDCKRLEDSISELKESLAESADLQTLIAFRKTVNAVDARDYKKYDIDAFCQLAQRALDSKDKALLSALAYQFCWYWHQGINTCYKEICAIAEALSQLAETADEKLTALAARKFIESRYELDIINVQIPYEGVELYPNFNSEEVIAWLRYLMEKSRRTADSQVKLIRDILAALYREILSPAAVTIGAENDVPYCTLTRPISTQSLITLLDIDLYLTSADDDHADTDECLHATDIAHELDRRRGLCDTLAANAITRYHTAILRDTITIAANW